MTDCPKYYVYPAIFQKDGGMWTVTFPDIENAFTSADSLAEAIISVGAVLEDCMYFREAQNDDIPAPTSLKDIDVPAGGIAQIVAADMTRARNIWRNEDEYSGRITA